MARNNSRKKGGRVLGTICAGVFGIVIVQGIPAHMNSTNDSAPEFAFFQYIAELALTREYDYVGQRPDAVRDYFNTPASEFFAAGLSTMIANQTGESDGALQIVLNIDDSRNDHSVLASADNDSMTMEEIVAINLAEFETGALASAESIAEIIKSSPNMNNLLLLEEDSFNRENANQEDSDLNIQLLAYAPTTTNENANVLLSPTIFGSILKDPLEEDATESHEWINGDLPASVLAESEQKCLADAVYFEARSETVEGQVAVAQVVLNRTLDPRYPDSICAVVYQNQHRRHQCQFSFACDGLSESVHSASAWRRAEKIAENVTNGISHLNSVGKSTHYHADYVNPHWANTMNKEAKIGQHIFYTTKYGG